jgi:hypothetical protein
VTPDNLRWAWLEVLSVCFPTSCFTQKMTLADVEAESLCSSSEHCD